MGVGYSPLSLYILLTLGKICYLFSDYFPRYLWGVDPAIILAITAKTTAKTLRSIMLVWCASNEILY